MAPKVRRTRAAQRALARAQEAVLRTHLPTLVALLDAADNARFASTSHERLNAHSSTLIRKTLSQPTSVYRGMTSLFRAEVVDHRIRNADWPGLEFLKILSLQSPHAPPPPTSPSRDLSTEYTVTVDVTCRNGTVITARHWFTTENSDSNGPGECVAYFDFPNKADEDKWYILDSDDYPNSPPSSVRRCPAGDARVHLVRDSDGAVLPIYRGPIHSDFADFEDHPWFNIPLRRDRIQAVCPHVTRALRTKCDLLSERLTYRPHNDRVDIAAFGVRMLFSSRYGTRLSLASLTDLLDYAGAWR